MNRTHSACYRHGIDAGRCYKKSSELVCSPMMTQHPDICIVTMPDSTYFFGGWCIEKNIFVCSNIAHSCLQIHIYLRPAQTVDSRLRIYCKYVIDMCAARLLYNDCRLG